MKKHITTSITINASADEVWEVFTDFERYPEWNPFVQSLQGEVKEGAQIKIQLPGMIFKPVVLKYQKPRELKWLGSLLFKGLFDGEHSFELSENQDGTTTFKQSENFEGILVRFFAKRLETETKDGFEKMNQALKERVENK